MSARVKIFRWRGIGPLLLVLFLLGLAWLAFGDRLVEDSGEEAGTELLGTQVDMVGLRVRETSPAITLRGLALADPFDRNRNLLETGGIELELVADALLEKKLVVDRLTVRDLRFGTARTTPAAPAPEHGFAATLLRAVADWREQFEVPVLRLSALDSGQQLVLDPAQLGTARGARSLVETADSLQRTIRAEVVALDPRPVIDSATAVVDRLATFDPKAAGLLSVRNAVQSVRRTIRAVDSVKSRVEALRATADSALALLADGVSGLDQARRRDYEFAKSLVQLPSFDAPEIGKALFGRVSLDRVQQALYWTELAERYLPPGLRPRETGGPKRLRAAGSTVRFPKAREYPSFLLREGEIDLAFDLGGATHTVQARLTGLTTAPALLGAPATLAATGVVGGANPMRVAVGALIDHTGPVLRDSVSARLVGLRLPSFVVPGLPFQVDPGRGSTDLVFVRLGDRLRARWTLRTGAAVWSRQDGDPAGGPLERIVWQVLSGLEALEVTAELEGPIRSPSFRVRSNLDEAIATRLRSLAGEQLARAEARVRAEVDRLVGGAMAEARARVETYREQAAGELARVSAELDVARSGLEGRLRALVPG